MKSYSYFPGCSASEGGAKAYNSSAQAVGKVLEVELNELEDWNCCGSTPYSSEDELSSLCLSARNLALAEKRGADLVTPCSSCYVMLNRTNTYLKNYPRLQAEITGCLAAGGLAYNGTVRVRHLLDVMVSDVGYEAIKAKVTRPLGGMKIAPYYGCQVVRPRAGFDHPELPQSLDKLIASLGAEPAAFPLKSRCCGGSLIISEEPLALELMYKLFTSAKKGGAQALVTVCPLCQVNLDAYQGRVNRKFKTNFHLPVLFFTQLMGIAFGLGERVLGLETNIVSAGKILAGAAKE